jgi:HD-GYP domain-containing protein (c-di-GMP phosphodiesterase class II)
MSRLPTPRERKFSAFITERVGKSTLVAPADRGVNSLFAMCNAWADLDGRVRQADFDALVLAAMQSANPLGMQLDPDKALVVAAAKGDRDAAALLVFSVQEGPISLACAVVRNALECWNLTQELTDARVALKDSTALLTQSYEEQRWLRGFARNASSFSRGGSANDMAGSILQPLRNLIRSQDVFLLVNAEETERSGLTDANYGSSNFSVQTIRDLLDSLHISPLSPPTVRNNVVFGTPDGVVHSLIAISVVDSQHAWGQLVGINRSTDSSAGGLCEPEFGSVDVGLLEEAAALLAIQAHNIHLFVKSNQLFLGTLHAMSSAIDARDKYTQGHSERVARLSYDLARILGVSDESCQEIYLAGILHDIGKIGVPDSVLLKNEALSPEELHVIQQHPEIGYRIVERLGHLQFVLPGILYHHERWDGRGYPHGLKGESIPLMARIMAVADAFDAMTSSRPYRQAMPIAKAEQIICAGGGKQWDAEAVECFKIWLREQTRSGLAPILPNQSIIPQDSPIEHITHAAMTLGH